MKICTSCHFLYEHSVGQLFFMLKSFLNFIVELSRSFGDKTSPPSLEDDPLPAELTTDDDTVADDGEDSEGEAGDNDDAAEHLTGESVNGTGDNDDPGEKDSKVLEPEGDHVNSDDGNNMSEDTGMVEGACANINSLDIGEENVEDGDQKAVTSGNHATLLLQKSLLTLLLFCTLFSV